MDADGTADWEIDDNEYEDDDDVEQSRTTFWIPE